MVVVGITDMDMDMVTGHGFLDSARRAEFKDIQHDYIRPNHYRVLGWSDDFYGFRVTVLSKIPIGKSEIP